MLYIPFWIEQNGRDRNQISDRWRELEGMWKEEAVLITLEGMNIYMIMELCEYNHTIMIELSFNCNGDSKTCGLT